MTNHHAGTECWSGLDGTDSTSTSLLQRAKAQDPEAWGQLVTLYGPVIYVWSRRLGLQPDDATDIIQEVFAAVASRIEGFRRDRPGDSFRGWLWTITRNKVRDHFRRLQGHARAQGGTDAQLRLAQIPNRPPDASTDAPPCDETGLERRAMEMVRAGVEDRTWQAFWQVTVDGRPVADVAEELGMSSPAVYKAKYRVIRQIRRELRDLLD